MALDVPYRFRSTTIDVPANGAVNYPVDFGVMSGLELERRPAAQVSVEGSSQVNAVVTTQDTNPNLVIVTLRNRFAATQTVRFVLDVTDRYHQG